MTIYGLIGKKLAHSFSADFFNTKFQKLEIEAVYKTFELNSIEQIFELIKKNPNLKGLNITIPYKSDIIKYLDFCDEIVLDTKACNTLKIEKGKLYGFNTDVIGFEKLFDSFLKQKPKNAIILGNGGAAKSVKFVLNKKNIPFQIVSREKNPESIPYSNLDKNLIQSVDLIINTTPLGMFPQIETYPEIPYEFIIQQHKIIDLVYNPSQTLFMQQCSKKGASATNGLIMLYEQAEAAWEIWKNKI